jgi:hypothetical protein
VEPGCYFVEATLGPALKDPNLSPFFVLEEIAKLRGSGGVRIEDDVVRRLSDLRFTMGLLSLRALAGSW